jgi:rod shape-determining protein MreD
MMSKSGYALKQFFLYFAGVVLFFLLQTTVFQWISLAGVVPNLLVIITVTAGFLNGSVPGIFCGLFCGLLADCMYGSVIGLYALFYMLDGYLAGIVHRFYSQEEEYTVPLLLIACGDLLFNFLYYLAEFLLRNRQQLGTYFVKIMLPELAYTVFAAVFFYKLLLWLHKLIEEGGQKEESNA